MDITLLIFLLVYVAMGFGQLPGFRVDRTGAALVGMLAMLVAGSISPQAAWDAIDYRTIGMLFGLMVVSAAFVVAGFYSAVARRIASLEVQPPALLAVLVLAGGVISSLLTKDVVAVAMTPLLVSLTLSRGLNPVPFLLGFCFATNTGSAGVLIGSPQNMITAQLLDISFVAFLKVALLPALVSLPVVWAVIAFLYRGRWTIAVPAQTALASPAQPATVLDRWETGKAGLVTLAVVAAFVFSPWPRELIALAAAAVLLLNRTIASRDLLAQVDMNLLLLITGLFVVNAALAATGLPRMLVEEGHVIGLNLHHPVVLLWVTAFVSDLVGNNPAVMLLVPLVKGATDPEILTGALALGTGFSSNLIVFGSLAGIIVVEQAGERGIRISFGEFARAGIPATVVCMALATGWIFYLML